ncbi:hypothetical protein BDZ89DRAFT_619691 [Hymenopellis radicata]|nr:hypothetical protein BDZ89DRAFT_619691 [Hymenopellis radicata]
MPSTSGRRLLVSSLRIVSCKSEPVSRRIERLSLIVCPLLDDIGDFYGNGSHARGVLRFHYAPSVLRGVSVLSSLNSDPESRRFELVSLSWECQNSEEHCLDNFTHLSRVPAILTSVLDKLGACGGFQTSRTSTYGLYRCLLC